jgi:HPt (histidine-containing phosphotransfer) domain-containing protein
VAQHPEHFATFLDSTRLPAWLDPKDRSGLLRLFLQSAHETMASLRQGGQADPRGNEALGHLLHGFKGAAMSVGAMPLAAMAKAFENALPELNRPAFHERLDALENCLQATESAIRPYLVDT